LPLRSATSATAIKIASRSVVIQHQTQRSVQFEITATTREALEMDQGCETEVRQLPVPQQAA
jgi:hypothetical protein